MAKLTSPTYILGLNITGPNTSACLISNDKILAFVEEERFTRIKLATDKFPINSIKYVLSVPKVGLEDIDQIAIGWDYNKYPGEMQEFYKRHMHHPKKDAYSDIVENLNLLQKTPMYITQNIQVQLWRGGLGKRVPIIKFYPHHKCHAASAAYLNPNDRAINFVIDGSGEELGTSVWVDNGTELENVENYYLPHSLGYFYAAMTEFLGFSVFTGEGKIMGMAPYGKPQTVYREKLKKFLNFDGKKYSVDPSYVYFGKRSTSLRHTDQLAELLERAPRVPESKIEQDDYDLAFETQWLLEKIVKIQFENTYKKFLVRNFTISGGVAMNCKMNGEISRLEFCDSLFVPPTSNDAGVALGSAMLAIKEKGHNPREIGATFSPYLGSEYSNAQILQILEEAKISQFEFLQENELLLRTAQAIKEGKIIGWFQGRMEVGSRALGNRSILANPTILEIKDKINREVKRREAFRPFAPAILSEVANQWFNFDHQSNPEITHRWMLQAAYVKEGVERIIPSVTHVDLSVRPQLVSQSDNLLFWKLIKTFESLTDVPILLNTSLNVRGEPIIRTPEEALRCYFSHGLDVLVMNNYVLEKK